MSEPKEVLRGHENLVGEQISPKSRLICSVHSYVEPEFCMGLDGEVFAVCWKCINESKKIELSFGAYVGPPGKQPIRTASGG